MGYKVLQNILVNNNFRLYLQVNRESKLKLKCIYQMTVLDGVQNLHQNQSVRTRWGT